MQSVLETIKQFVTGNGVEVEPEAVPVPKDHLVTIFGPEGMSLLSWAKGDQDGQTKAQRMFDTMLAQGFMAVRKGGDGQATEQVMVLDETIEEVELLPQMRGG